MIWGINILSNELKVKREKFHIDDNFNKYNSIY